MMETLDQLLMRVEKYGFSRDAFPRRIEEHTVEILSNDAREKDDGRVHVHFTLWCRSCRTERCIRGTFEPPEEFGKYVQTLKLVPLGWFIVNDCA